MAVFASGNKLTPARLNAHGAVARRAAVQSIPNNTTTDISLDSEVYDNASMFVPTSATITIPSGGDGLYRCSAWAVFAINATGWRRIAISKNNGTTLGVDTWHDIQMTTDATGDSARSVTIDIPLVAGDTIRIKAWQTSGGALNIDDAQLTVIRQPGA